MLAFSHVIHFQHHNKQEFQKNHDSSETLACYGVGSESRGRKQASTAKPLQQLRVYLIEMRDALRVINWRVRMQCISCLVLYSRQTYLECLSANWFIMINQFALKHSKQVCRLYRTKHDIHCILTRQFITLKASLISIKYTLNC